MRNIHISGARYDIDIETPEDKSLFYASGLIITVAFILLFGLTMLYSTSYGTDGTKYFYNQLAWTFIGLASGAAVFAAGYRRLSSISLVLVGGTILLLMIAALCFPAINGAHRWIRIKVPGVTTLSIQPSEFAKIAMALFLSKYCADNIRFINDISVKRGFLPGAFVCGTLMGCVFLGKDLGTTLLLAAVCGIVFFTAGMRLLYLAPPVLLGVPALGWVLKHFDPERWSRLTSFLYPEQFQKTDGYQLWNSLLALGSGKWLGIGFMESRLKAKYLPEAHTDFILSIVGEELGLISILLLMFAYIAFLYFAVKISLNAKTKQGMLLGIAITATIILQALINIGVVSGSIPTKGMPAPFISYGGSNLLMCLISVGLLINIAVETAMPGFNDELIDSFKQRFNWLRRKN